MNNIKGRPYERHYEFIAGKVDEIIKNVTGKAGNCVVKEKGQRCK